MNTVNPKVYLIAATELQSQHITGVPDIRDYLEDVGAPDWETSGSSPEKLAEIAGRLCYRSWAPGLNVNVTKVREGNKEYLANILDSRHGSVMEHASVSFIFRHVSRVFTHELVRHRVGVGISQESMRYVRLDGEIPLVLPGGLMTWDPARKERDVLDSAIDAMDKLQEFLAFLAGKFKLDDPNARFSVKKAMTSFMRRFVPMGVATDILWTANIRILRHVIEMRTDEAAEWEIRQVFDQVAGVCSRLYPNLFQDFVRLPGGAWTTLARARALWVLGKTGDWSPPDATETMVDIIPVRRVWLEEWANRMKGNQ